MRLGSGDRTAMGLKIRLGVMTRPLGCATAA